MSLLPRASFQRTTEANRSTEIRVIDDGPGLPAQTQESVFDPFLRIDKSCSRALGGVGLGLALARQIAQLHGGELRIEESCKTGTVFLCVL